MVKNRLEIKDLCVEVDGKVLLDNLNLTVPRGEIHALMGMNGCGKSSLMMTIMGFEKYKVTSGYIKYEGIDITDLGVSERAKLGIGIALQRPPIVSGVSLKSILEFIEGGEISEEAMEYVKSSKMLEYLHRDLNDGFSGGETKRAEILQLLLQSPGFVMMDEPDSGVDLESLKLIGNTIESIFDKDNHSNHSGLIVTHYGAILDYVKPNKAHIMMNGKIRCSGDPKTILKSIKNKGYEACILCMEKGS